MSDTTHLQLPLLAAAQAQKHVTHNDALLRLDAVVQLAVLDRDLTAAPSVPVDGDRYIVASGATGIWSGWDLNIATYGDGVWTKLVPREGWLAWVADEDVLVVHTGSVWSIASGGGGGGAVASVNGLTGTVVLDADAIDDAATANKFATAAELSKLAGIESGATADQSDAEIETAYNSQVAIVAQAEAEAGTATTARRWTAERVAQAIAALAPGGGGAVDSVNGLTGVVVLDADDIDDTATANKFATAGELSKLAGIEAAADVTDAGNVGAAINGASAKTTPVDADRVGLIDSAAGNALKTLTWANIKATLKAYFDTLYHVVGGTDVPVADGGTGASTAAGARTNLGVAYGVQELWVPAAAWIPTITNGAQRHVAEDATNDMMEDSLAFDTSTQEFATWDWAPPKRWDGGTVAVVPYWRPPTGTLTSQTVQFGFSAVAVSNDDALDAAPGTAQTSTDTWIADGDLHIGPATSAITIAGTPADADLIRFKVSRNVASDDLAGDARLVGVLLRWTNEANNDA